MVWLTALLLIAITSTAVGQCEYVYVAEPPDGQLICDPFPINQLQLVCSIFATDISQLDVLRIQWFFSAPINSQFNPTNAVQLQSNRFTIAQRETYTSRIVVSNPPIGFYFCQPVLASQRQLIRSNVVPLQPQRFYQQRQIRPCLMNEFQNSSNPICAQLGIMLGPDQVIAPAPTVVDTLQHVSSTIPSTMLTPTPILAQGTATPVAREGSNTTGLIAGVVVGSVIIIVVSVLIIVGVLILIQVKMKVKSKLPRTHDSRHISNGERYTTATVSFTEQTDEIQDSPFVPPRKPPPKLQRLTFGTNRSPQITNNHYNRLRFPNAKRNKSQLQPRHGSESSAYYITPEHNSNDEVEYYVEFDEKHLEQPYIDESESLIYTDSQYSTESDLHLHQQGKQESIVSSSSLELQLDKGDVHAQAAKRMNAASQLPHKYQNISPKSNLIDQKMAKSSAEEYSKTSHHQEVIDITRELRTEYINAVVLERSTVV